MTTIDSNDEKEIITPSPSSGGGSSPPISSPEEEDVDEKQDNDSNGSNGLDGSTVGTGKTSDSGEAGDRSSAEITGTTGSGAGTGSDTVSDEIKTGSDDEKKSSVDAKEAAKVASTSSTSKSLRLKTASIMDRMFGQRHPIGLTPQPQSTARRWTFLCGVFLAVAVVVGIAVAIGVLVGGSKNKDSQNDGNASGIDGESSLAELGLCGNGYVGNGTCEHGLCCSLYGWCGYSEAHCINGQVPPPDVFDENSFCGEREGIPGNGTCANSTECCWVDEGKCELSYWACGGWWYNTTRGRPCGYGEVGDGTCEKEGECCSEWGWCGTTDDYCPSGGRRRNLRSNSTNANFTTKVDKFPPLVPDLSYQEQKNLFEMKYKL